MKPVQPNSTDSNDEKDLRDYLQETFQGLRDDRSTYSYALEFLRTERANLLTGQVLNQRLLATIEKLKQEIDAARAG